MLDERVGYVRRTEETFDYARVCVCVKRTSAPVWRCGPFYRLVRQNDTLQNDGSLLITASYPSPLPPWEISFLLQRAGRGTYFVTVAVKRGRNLS